MNFKTSPGNIISNKNGMALLVTLALISVVCVAVFELTKKLGASALTIMSETNNFKAEKMAFSGINLAMLILANDANHSNSDIDSIQEPWADPVKLAKAVNALEFKDGELVLSISDELGKIQINALINEYPGHKFNEHQKKLWERFLALAISSDKSLDVRNASEIINCIKDWLDSNDDDAITGLSGAESEYYEALNYPYQCSNGPLNKVDELLMIKGISQDLLKIKKNSMELYSDIITKNQNIANLEQDLIVFPSLSQIFTVFGIEDNNDNKKVKNSRFKYPGTININTANGIILASILPVGMEDQAKELIAFRSEKNQNSKIFANTLDKGWYKQIIKLSQNEKKQFEKLIRYSSSVYRAEAKIQFNTTNVSLIGFIKREKNKETGKWQSKLLKLDRK
ncbi:MAG: hypothetical protein B6I26_05850 [Desulfobacteraceae bacterium 4572_130]|nr:MAG: hypothetical protein B6I26_05850 [Desulfobacteraceae bacterium 4572_130]